MSSTDSYGACLPPPVIGTPSARQRTSFDRRREAKALPRPMYVYNAITKRIVLAVILALCECLSSADDVHWFVTGGVALDTPYEIGTDGPAYISNVFRLQAAADFAARSQLTTAGHSVNHHYPEHASADWRCFRLDGVECQRLSHEVRRGNSPTSFVSPREFARACGVAPTCVVSLSHATHIESVSAVFPEEDQTVVPSSSVADVLRAAKQHLESLSTSVDAGLVTHRFAPDTIFR